METGLAARLGYLVVGAAAAAGDSAVSAVRDVAGLPPLAHAVARLGSITAAVSRTRVAAPVVAALAELEQRGRDAVASGETAVLRVADAAAARAARSEIVVRTVNGIVDQVIWPIVDEVIPVVLDRLAEHPEPVRALVVGQSAGVASDLASAARAGAERADERVASVVDRLLRRRPRPATAVTPPPIGALPT
jgi:hypothetical protein